MASYLSLFSSRADPSELPVDEAIDLLDSDNLLVQRRARMSLLATGDAALGPLLDALERLSSRARMGAAKTLAEFQSPAVAPVLVSLLEDNDPAVRWTAAEGLAAIGLRALPSLLKALTRGADSVWLRQGAHHVLCSFLNTHLEWLVSPVLEALDGQQPALQVPHVAIAALHSLNG